MPHAGARDGGTPDAGAPDGGGRAQTPYVSGLPGAALPEAALPEAALPEAALPEPALPGGGPSDQRLSDALAGGDLRGVLAVRPFRRLWISLAFSSFGDWLGLLATTALAQQLQTGLTGKSFAIAGVLVVRLIPSVILGPLAGAFADRFDRRTTMVVSDILRGALFVSIPLVATLPWLLIASFLIESVSLFWTPAKDASVPNLLKPHQLEAANQLSLVTTYGSAPAAAAVFALLSTLNRVLASGFSFFTTNPVDLALYFNAATFIFAALTIATLKEIGRARQERPDEEAVGLIASIVEGWRFARRQAVVRGVLFGLLGVVAAAGCVIALGRLFVGLFGGGDAAYGVLFGALFVGLAGGMAVGPKLLGDFSRRRLYALSIIGAGITLAVLSVLPNLVLAVLLTTVVGGFVGIVWVTGYTLVGREVEDDVRGRTFSLIYSLMRVDLLLALTAAPLLVGAIGEHSVTLSNGARIRADGVTVVLLAAGLLATALGVLSFRQMDDRPGVPVIADVIAGLRGARGVVRPRLPGVFVAFEGGEGAGKSTQARLLAVWLREQGHEVVLTRQPGGSPTGARMRALLLDTESDLHPRTEALLYAADRAEHVERVIRPALEAGRWVISDRYVDSSLAYQGAGRRLAADEVARLSAWATDGLTPDLVVLLDVPPEAGLARAAERGAADRLEEEPLAFHRRVRTAFLRLAAAAPRRYVVVDGARTVDDVQLAVRAGVVRHLPAGLAVPADVPVKASGQAAGQDRSPAGGGADPAQAAPPPSSGNGAADVRDASAGSVPGGPPPAHAPRAGTGRP